MTTAEKPEGRRMTAADYRAQIADLLAEFDRLQERIEARKQVIEQLKVETREVLTSLGAKL